MSDYTNLTVWNRVMELAEGIYRVNCKFPCRRALRTIRAIEARGGFDCIERCRGAWQEKHKRIQTVHRHRLRRSLLTQGVDGKHRAHSG